MSHIDIKRISTKMFFQPTFFSLNFVASGHILDTFLTSNWPHVLMSIWYLQFDISPMSQSGLVMLCNDIDQMFRSIWGSSVHWALPLLCYQYQYIFGLLKVLCTVCGDNQTFIYIKRNPHETVYCLVKTIIYTTPILILVFYLYKLLLHDGQK